MQSIVSLKGANAFIEALQDPISHLIIRGFQRRANEIDNISEYQKINILQQEIENFNEQLRYPYGKLCLAEANARSDDPARQYYAIKELIVLIEVIDSENFTRYLVKTDTSFNDAWATARNMTLTWRNEILSHELLRGDAITSTTLNLFRRLKHNDKYIKDTTLNCLRTIRFAWQMIWRKFLSAKTSLSHITENRDNNFIYRLTKLKPELNDQNYFLLGINKKNNIRMWVNLDDGLYKARPTTRKLKWVNIDTVNTKIKPLWYLYAVKNNNNDSSTENEVSDRDDLSYDFSATTIY